MAFQVPPDVCCGVGPLHVHYQYFCRIVYPFTYFLYINHTFKLCRLRKINIPIPTEYSPTVADTKYIVLL